MMLLLTLSLKKITRKNIFFARTLINVVLLFMAFIFKGPLVIGTALAVCFSGAILNVFMPCTAFIKTSIDQKS